jgi:hypothetical protein
MSEPEKLIRQIKVARLYTRDLLHSIPAEDWFREPSEGVTTLPGKLAIWRLPNIAWPSSASGAISLRMNS